MFKIVKWFVVVLIVVAILFFLVTNAELIRQPVSFQVQIPTQDAWTSPNVSLGAVFAACVVIGAAIMSLAGIVRIFGLRRQLKQARRRIADLEEEVVAYRGRAARESDFDEDEGE